MPFIHVGCPPDGHSAREPIQPGLLAVWAAAGAGAAACCGGARRRGVLLRRRWPGCFGPGGDLRGDLLWPRSRWRSCCVAPVTEEAAAEAAEATADALALSILSAFASTGPLS